MKQLPGQAAVGNLFYSPDSTTLWIGGPNLHTGNGVYRLTNLDHAPRLTVTFPGAHAIAADTNGRHLVVAYTTSVREFDAHTLKPLTQTITVAGTLLIEVYSAPDGHSAVVESPQGWRLIDLNAQQPIGPWIQRVPLPALIGADGNTIYSKARNGGGEIWDVSRANINAAACGLAGRNLTKQEWDKYLTWARTPPPHLPPIPVELKHPERAAHPRRRPVRTSGESPHPVRPNISSGVSRNAGTEAVRGDPFGTSGKGCNVSYRSGARSAFWKCRRSRR